MRKLTIALLLATAVAAPGAARDRNLVPEATPAGPAQNCVQSSAIRETHVRNDSVIDFEMRGGKVYRNTLPDACPSLGFEQRFLYKTSTNELCSVDIITVLTEGGGLSRGASCGLGSFQPVTLVKPHR